MNKNGIDDLLKVVSPDLIAGYEKKNLDGKTLREICEEYKDVNTKRAKIPNDLLLFSVITPMVGISGTVVVTLFLTNSVEYSVVLAVIGAILFLVFLNKLSGKASEYSEVMTQYEKVFSDFRQSLDALNPLEANLYTYTSDSVWGTLFLLAVKVLEAKLEFVKACRQENPSISEVKTIIELEQHYRARFNSMFDASSKFGLDFSKDRLYRSAQEKIDENKAWW